ncbi:MAG: DNA translocase FtsK 4TM domain-containing protein [Nitrospirota bacterium]
MPSPQKSSAVEMAGVFLFLMGCLLAISLFTYHPTDPSLSTFATSPVVQNAIGKFGAVISDLFFQLIGIGAYLLPLFVCTIGIRALQTAPEKTSGLKKLGYAVLMLLVCAWADLLFQSSDAINLKGGTIGYSINQTLIEYFAHTGTYVLLFFFSISGIMLVSPFSPGQIFERSAETAALFLESIKARFPKKRRRDVPVAASTLQEDEPDSLSNDEMETYENDESADVSMANPYDNDPMADQYDIEADPVFEEGVYQIPPLSLLSDPPIYTKKVTPEELNAQAQILKRKLLDFGVSGEVKEIHPGPVVTLFEFEPAPGIKLNKITTLADDLALAMRALQVRIVPRIPGKSVVGIEIPNRTREEVFLKEILASPSFAKIGSKLRLSFGKDIFGTPVAADMAEMPHLLMAGSTGSGKSVGLNSMILSILFSAKPTEVKLLLIDPKMLELSLYEDIPHLISPVITRPKAASEALRKMVIEMQRRYELLAEMGVRNINAYNKLFDNPPVVRPPKSQSLFNATSEEDSTLPAIAMPPLARLPYIVVCIDELADLMVVASRDVEESIGRLAQMARAAGIHLILATQRPSVDVLTGVIKANFPARIAYAVISKTDSRTILDANGAEQLLGKGDMLYMSGGKLLRIHGAYVSEEEVKRVVSFIKEQAKPHYEQIFSLSEDSTAEGGTFNSDVRDELYETARDLVLTTGQASASFIQRRMRVGYPRAAHLVEMMEADGVVGPAIGSKPREILLKRNPDVHTHNAFTE